MGEKEEAFDIAKSSELSNGDELVQFPTKNVSFVKVVNKSSQVITGVQNKLEKAMDVDHPVLAVTSSAGDADKSASTPSAVKTKLVHESIIAYSSSETQYKPSYFESYNVDTAETAQNKHK